MSCTSCCPVAEVTNPSGSTLETVLRQTAAGRYEGFWETALSPWDLAGGVVIVREAGGLVSQIDGRDDILFGESILAANQRLYDPIRKMLIEALHDEGLKLSD